MNGALKKFSFQGIVIFENKACKQEVIEIYPDKICEKLNKLNNKNSRVFNIKD